jgi:hypothetical protein
MRTALLFVATVVLVTACRETITGLPFYGPRLPRAATTLANVDVTLIANATAVSPGDSVIFSVTATNRSTVRVQLGQQCGPMMDVAVLAPTGAEQSALVGDRTNVAFECPLPETFFANPGESRTITIGWRAPALRGRYEARGALRRTDGLGNESATVTVLVR